MSFFIPATPLYPSGPICLSLQHWLRPNMGRKRKAWELRLQSRIDPQLGGAGSVGWGMGQSIGPLVPQLSVFNIKTKHLLSWPSEYFEHVRKQSPPVLLKCTCCIECYIYIHFFFGRLRDHCSWQAHSKQC